MHFTHKNILIIVLAALLVGGAFLLAEFKNQESKKAVYTSPITAATAELSSDLQNIDSDEDGLKDWEEVLLGTDTRIADTDRDGSSDGKEASSGRNPLVKGPNDRAKDGTASSAPGANLTPTEKIARDFFARYMELSQIGLASDVQSQQELVGQVLKNGLVLDVPVPYKIDKITISSDASTEALQRYGEAVGTVLKNNQLLGRDETVITKEALETENPAILKEIDPIISTYKNIIASLLKIPAPAAVAQSHLNLINATNHFLFVAESLRKSDVDPLKGLQGVKEHPNAAAELIQAFQDIRTRLLAEKIRYLPNENGYMFTN